MPDKKFLEEYQLYRKFDMTIPKELSDIPAPTINLKCKNCNSIQTFKMKNYWFDRDDLGSNSESKGKVLHAHYVCMGCDNYEQDFLIKISDNLDYIIKVGQFPPWNINIDKHLEKLLGKHVDTYKKGLINESQGYGIGSYVYYRRIVEEIIDELLNSVLNVIENEKDKKTYLEALEKVKRSHNATDKISVVMDLVPSSLKTEENNPLSIIHSAISRGIHSLSDEECLTNAVYIRESLAFLVSEIITHSNATKNYNNSLKRLAKK